MGTSCCSIGNATECLLLKSASPINVHQVQAIKVTALDPAETFTATPSRCVALLWFDKVKQVSNTMYYGVYDVYLVCYLITIT